MNELYSKLVGDGICDDTQAIQALLDSGAANVHLPPPKKEYLISKCLKIHSNTAFVLDRMTRIVLAPHSDCVMLENDETGAQNIYVSGGVWDYNNMNQRPNPLEMGDYAADNEEHWKNRKNIFDPAYLGVAMRFSNIKNFTLKEVTIKDPITFGIQVAYLEQFTFDDLTFDYNYGNPCAVNMDGLHLDGGCRFGRISNLKGSCYDDLLAINADDLCRGPIEDIEVDGLFAKDCHSAIRFLSTTSPVRRMSISNVYGTYYQYGIGFTSMFGNEKECGYFEDISLNNIFISKAPRHSIYQRDGHGIYAVIWMSCGALSNISISNFHRQEAVTAVQSIWIEKDAKIASLSLANCSQANATGEKMPFMMNDGSIEKLVLYNVIAPDDELLINNGSITKTVVGG